MEYMKGCRTMAVKAGALIDGTGRPPVKNAVVLIEDSTVKEVGQEEKVDIPKEAGIIDATQKTVIPGLFECHIHLMGRMPSPYAYWYMHGRLNAMTLGVLASPAWTVLLDAFNGREWLDRGITTLRDLSRCSEVTVCLKKAQQMGIVTSSKIVSSGQVFSTASQLCSVVPPPLILHRADLGVADGVDEIRKRVRDLVLQEADCMKTSSGSGCATGELNWRNYTLEELTALCDEAQAWGRTVACHCHSAASISNIVHASAAANATTTVDHGSFLKDCDSETIKLMKEKPIYLVPTVGIHERPPYAQTVDKMPEPYRHNIQMVEGVAKESFRFAVKEGIKIAFGTDVYPELFPERSYPGKGEDIPIYKLELQTYVRWGMQPIDVIRAATLASAEACGVANQTGSIEAGKSADILVVRGNPLEDIGMLGDKQNIDMVIQDGKIIVNRT